MKAKVLKTLLGANRCKAGDTVEGDFALHLVEIGYAVPIVEKPTKETASKKTVSKETRSKK